MSSPSRRNFLAALSTGALAGCVLGSARTWAAPASERFRIGVIGSGNQGNVHYRALSEIANAEIAYVCDIDEQRLAEGVETTGAQGVADLRRVLDDPSIDGVTIALPDHWHVPAALLALAAGKHVYIEKPTSHNFREGQLLRAAAKKSGLTVQHGTQARSSPGIQEAISHLRDGIIGDVLVAKCWNWQTRKSIGHEQPTTPPAGVDYETWVGPAEWLPYQKNRFHYDWHWWFNFGAGDLGNDGVHEMDYALWGLGVIGAPKRISGSGGVYFFHDDRQWPDTQQITFEYQTPSGERMLIYEQRLWSNSYPYNVDSGAEFYGSKGKLFVSKRGKFDVFDEEKNRIPLKLDGVVKPEVALHMQNWIDSAKNGKTPNAPVECANCATTAIHLGNISTRLQRSLVFDAEKEQIVDDPAANALLGRKYRAEGHWSIPKFG
ncbi:MAG: Gfo/Idh/MocA family oxidoreductase [Bythopirellula sp.]|nr:Gfo/Idh/MocA family oxidoreductase [Bythopirellula sp.]